MAGLGKQAKVLTEGQIKAALGAVAERLLRAKPLAWFVRQVAPAKLREAADFLMDVAAADKAKVD